MKMEIFLVIMSVIIFVETTVALLKNTNLIISKHGKRKIFVDTSSLIDGRILSVAMTGFIGDELIITRSVIDELQLLADGADSEKRARARFGLDVISSLQKIDYLDVTVLQDDEKVPSGVDRRLIELAKKYHGRILTNDFNLNKVAVAEGLRVLNINDLSQNLRSSFLPGDKLRLELIQKGSIAGQAVGYLADGTMVVVEDAESHIGTTVEIEFVRYLQTSAGKMMFAKEVGAKPKDRPAKKSTPKTGRAK
jgi:uncharacterized protein YacL